MASEPQLRHCPVCELLHRQPALLRGQRAECVRCGATIAQRGWLGRDSALAFAVGGLVLALPALFLPFVTLERLGNQRVNLVATGFEGFRHFHMPVLAAAVLVCGLLLPVLLLAVLIAALLAEREPERRRWCLTLERAAHALQRWSMPEVQLLAILVALFKLGSVVNVQIGPGLWFYAATALCGLAAWRQFSLEPRVRLDPARAGGAS